MNRPQTPKLVGFNLISTPVPPELGARGPDFLAIYLMNFPG
jgi:hypothetical protein